MRWILTCDMWANLYLEHLKSSRGHTLWLLLYYTFNSITTLVEKYFNYNCNWYLVFQLLVTAYCLAIPGKRERKRETESYLNSQYVQSFDKLLTWRVGPWPDGGGSCSFWKAGPPIGLVKPLFTRRSLPLSLAGAKCAPLER